MREHISQYLCSFAITTQIDDSSVWLNITYMSKSRNKKKALKSKGQQRKKESLVKRFFLYTDGSCNNNAQPHEGGYAYILTDENRNVIRQFSEGAIGVTNNQMELKAIIEGCKSIKEDDSEVTIVSDSKYALNVLSGKWNASMNVELVAEHSQNSKRLKLKYRWVKGHNGEELNELADKLAGIAAQEALKRYYSANPPAKDNGTVTESFSYRVYATSVWNYDITGNAYMIIDSDNNVVDKKSMIGGQNQYREILKTIIEACHNIPEVGVDVEVLADSQYAINILSGRWHPKKNFDLIQEQYDYERHSHITYLVCGTDSLYMKEIVLLANQRIARTINEVAHSVYMPMSEHLYYDVGFTAMSLDLHHIRCCYSIIKSSDSTMVTRMFDLKVEDFDNTDINMLSSLLQIILVEVFKKIPDATDVRIHSVECYQLLIDLFSDEKGYDSTLSTISKLKFTSDGRLRRVSVYGDVSSRIKHALRRKLALE